MSSSLHTDACRHLSLAPSPQQLSTLPPFFVLLLVSCKYNPVHLSNTFVTSRFINVGAVTHHLFCQFLAIVKSTLTYIGRELSFSPKYMSPPIALSSSHPTLLLPHNLVACGLPKFRDRLSIFVCGRRQSFSLSMMY